MERQEKVRSLACEIKQLGMSGVTYLELIMVLLLLGIFVMLGLPALNAAMGDARLSGAAQEVVNALEFAQLTAITSGRRTRVVIGAPEDRIAIRQFTITADLSTGGDTLADADVENGTFDLMGNPMNKGMDYQIDFPVDTRFQGVDITASDFNFGDPVFFDTLGAPSKGGTVTLALAGGQMVVTLDALTGKVTVSP
ncbi:MAG: GspH/FimT family protein [Desulfobacterales bacterium]|jgi:type II secretory pathway pseudopilin PulG